ncbi:hypothetical protein OC926_25895 [Pseudomonas peradeniyensis]|uniref:hypothetical protein n=1 Tax=Pseudomonas peradeniyensis TaxID=2745488 RepID=UPI0021D4A62E|nr:hypothetical protein [Pseudomonas peradeniyensis]MCU7283270.1 hypothetical protein [Pseudomonas peradeniyensis]
MDSVLLEKNLGENFFYCRVDTFRASKDYLQGGLCIRFIGIESKSKKDLNQEDGIQTFIVDLDLWKFAEILYKLSPDRGARDFIYALEDDPDEISQWYVLHVKYRHHELNYLYATFSEDRPKYFEIKSIAKVNDLDLTVRPPSQSLSFIRETLISSGNWAEEDPKSAVLSLIMRSEYFGGDFVLESFHVGQGMCSLVHNGSWGMLLDMGAGKPVNRPKYPMLLNGLHEATKSLKSLSLLLSHFDSDHWRMLAWDQKLRRKIEKIYVPSGDRPPVFNDVDIKGRVVQMDDAVVRLAADTLLRVYRSSPSKNDSNGQCLVATFYKGGKLALLPGDYAYQRFASDGNAGISKLLDEVYSAVVVPHHGDLASSKSVVDCVQGSPAFFSAGTHQGYNHPTAASVEEHKNKKFKIVEDKAQKDIVRKLLL